MILDILTVLFFVLGFVLVLWMIGERRRDVLHGPYVTRALCGRDAGIGAFVFVAHFRAPSKISRLCSVCRQTFQAGSRPTGLRWARHRQLSRELRWRDYLQALTQWLQLKCGSVVTNRLHSLRAAIHQMAGVSVLETGCGQAFEQPLVDDFGNYWGHGDGAKTTHLIMKA
jgi:hypothetical protein